MLSSGIFQKKVVMKNKRMSKEQKGKQNKTAKNQRQSNKTFKMERKRRRKKSPGRLKGVQIELLCIKTLWRNEKTGFIEFQYGYRDRNKTEPRGIVELNCNLPSSLSLPHNPIKSCVIHHKTQSI